MNTLDNTLTEPLSGRPAFLRGWRAWAVGGAALLLVWFLFFRGGKKDAGPNPAGRPVPVAVAQARKGDMAVHLTGLGTVTALNNVTVRSRVDGQLVRVAFTEGQMVREGDLLAEIDSRPFRVQLMQAEGQFAKDQAAAQNAQADLRRLEGLVKQGIISRQQLDTQTSSVAQYEAALKSDQAQVENAKLNLTYSRITAPISGRVGLRLVDVGNMVRASDANGLATIAPVQPINVVFAIPADNIQKVLSQSAKGAKLPVEAWDRDLKSRLASGSLAAIDNQVDTATGTVRLKAIFANEDRILFPNQFVNAQLLVDTLKGVVIIPTAAIQRGPQGAFVYAVKPDATVELRVIEPQGTDGDSTAIAKGLSGGETIVVDGLEKLRPGSKVALPKASGGKG
ncbi:MAG: MdtA/MuxA family multidrug efflux RND transporter periplasmic adaptor subunit [Acidobacteria bacterium]|nr:MdtA/MuxA family multidrug efflux RND transporter periplasmic adaptor subunit [Acidobacteriota bacterium]MBI3488368.1 MdtA/MuxA family multidrug efflux RND transporter periplasmic adaptor subunit [Acidobacteriota bacterium]